MLLNCVVYHEGRKLADIDKREISDYLARLSTGISQAKRLLYSNGDEVVTRMLGPEGMLVGLTVTPSMRG